MARTPRPRPRPARGPQRRRHRDEPRPRPRARCPAAGDSPAAAVLAALSAEPAGATVAVIAARAGISTAAARQALLAHEKAGTATRVKGGRPGIADTWKPAPALAAPGDEAPPAEAPGADADAGKPSAEPADSTADAGQPPARRPCATRAARSCPAYQLRRSPGYCPRRAGDQRGGPDPRMGRAPAVEPSLEQVDPRGRRRAPRRQDNPQPATRRGSQARCPVAIGCVRPGP